MKIVTIIHLVSVIAISPLIANDAFQADLKKNADPTKAKALLSPEETLKKHAKASIQTADGQDQLSADVQDLIQEQANQKVVQLLDEAESLMGEATELLENKNTGSNTIAIQTEIIEKIYEAAQEKQKQQQQQPGQPQPSSPMMEMMKGMMGQGQGESQEPGESEGEGEGTGGEGKEGSSDTASDNTSGSANNTKEERRVPKSTSTPSQNLPKEEQRALDAYNK